MTTASVNEVLSYLNKFSVSCIRPLVVPIISDIDNENTGTEALDVAIQEALEKSQYPFIPQEFAEIKLHSGAALAIRKRNTEAGLLFEDALGKLEDDLHRRAIATWMMGSNALELQNDSFAFQHWKNSTELMEEIIKRRLEIELKNDMLEWYQKRIWELNLLLSSCIQEIYGWFGAYETGHLDEETILFSERIFKDIASGQQENVQKLIERVIEISKVNHDYQQVREAQVLCGVAEYLSGRPEQAVKRFADAINKLEPKSQRQAVTYWLKGMAQWRLPQQHDEGMGHFKKAFELFKELRLKADQKHLVPLVAWYNQKIAIMEADIKQKQKELVGF